MNQSELEHEKQYVQMLQDLASMISTDARMANETYQEHVRLYKSKNGDTLISRVSKGSGQKVRKRSKKKL